MRRRSLLGALLTVALGGCGQSNSSPSTTDTVSSAPTTTSVSTTDDPETTNGTSGPDERVKTSPPGDPPLDPAGTWPQFRFDKGNTGANPGGVGIRDGESYWRLRPSGPASIDSTTLYNVTTRERTRGLSRRRPTTFEVTTHTPLVGYGVNSPPALAGDRVFVTTFIEVFCLAADREEILWRGPEMDGIQAAPTVAGDQVVVNSGGFQGVAPHIRAFDVADGTERWRYDTDAETKGTPAVADETVYVTATDGLHAVDATSGERLFHQPTVTGRWASPATDGEHVYAMSRAEGASELVVLDAVDGTERWRQPTPAMDTAPPVVTNDSVYIATEDGIVALDPSDGTERATLGGRGQPVALVGDVLYATERGILYAIDTAGDGELWSHTTEEVQIEDTVGQHIYGVTPVDGAVYVSARDAFHGIGPRQ